MHPPPGTRGRGRAHSARRTRLEGGTGQTREPPGFHTFLCISPSSEVPLLPGNTGPCSPTGPREEQPPPPLPVAEQTPSPARRPHACSPSDGHLVACHKAALMVQKPVQFWLLINVARRHHGEHPLSSWTRGGDSDTFLETGRRAVVMGSRAKGHTPSSHPGVRGPSAGSHGGARRDEPGGTWAQGCACGLSKVPSPSPPR